MHLVMPNIADCQHFGLPSPPNAFERGKMVVSIVVYRNAK